jgi:hypothetical protein
MNRAIVVLALAASSALGQPALKTKNVFLVMSDGLRWQEVFRGGDPALMTKAQGVEDELALKKRFLRENLDANRWALMPFLWTTVARQGQIYGNLDKHSDAHVTNGMWFSYPGYNETFCGFADPAIDSNKPIPNQNVTVFEWLHNKPAFRGRVAAFGTWDVFPAIFNTTRCGFPVDDCLHPLNQGTLSPQIELLNTLKKETPRRWGGVGFDSLEYHTALEWLALNKPRVMFLGLGETDEWGHEGNYAEYLTAAHRADGYIGELWTTCQSIPEYQGTTTFVITCDHGRGDNTASPKDWNNHGAKHPGSGQIWLAVLGPDTPPLGEGHDCDAITQSQIAATIAVLLGENYNVAQPKAGLPIKDALPKP